MRKEYIQMLTSVVVLLLIFVFNSPVEINEETASVLDATENVEMESSEVTAEVTETVDVEVENKDEVYYPESFNNEELEKEYGDVQSGIDLLDNPF